MKENVLTTFSGFMLMIGGLLYGTIQIIHPPDALTSVGENLYFVVAILTSLMSLAIFLGILSLYEKNAQNIGYLGLVGMVLWGIFWLISMIFSFNEAFVLPLLVDSAPEFVTGITGLFNNVEVSVSLGIFPQLAMIAGLLYVIGGFVLGLSFLKGKVFSKGISLLLCIASALTITSGILPHPLDRGLAIPMAIALILMGYAEVRQSI